MPNDLVTSAWAPGLIGRQFSLPSIAESDNLNIYAGLAISSLLYGTSLAQTVHYAWFFPNDPTPIKWLVFLVFVADALHLIGSTQFYWTMMVLCHRSDALVCERDLPWGAYIGVPVNYIITFTVQCFYCHRVWIISENNKSITTVIFLIAFSQLALGIWASIESIKDGTVQFLYTTPLVPIAAGVSTMCDITITCIILKHLWRSELRDRLNVIRDLVVIFVNMGALTCFISIAVGVVFFAQGNHYLVGAPAVVISRCYVNSLLAVLNARRALREREMRWRRDAIEMPTISTIIL